MDGVVYPPPLPLEKERIEIMFQKTVFYYEKWREKKIWCISCRQIYDSQHLDKAHKSCQSKAKKNTHM